MRKSVLAATATAGVVIALVCWSPSMRGPKTTDPADADPSRARGASAARPVRRSGSRGARAEPPGTVVDERARACEETKARLRAAVAEDRWNDALRGLDELGNLCRSAEARRAIGFDELSAQIVSGRDRWFAERTPPKVFETMDALSAAKVGESASASAGFAAARGWQSREFPAGLWEKVATDLGLGKDELEKYWRSRRVVEPRTASYGTGSCLVAKKPRAAEPGERPRTESEKPVTDEDWWSAADAAARGAWLTASFVESSGMFEVLRAGEAACAGCGGSGAAGSGVCPNCNGCGAIRTVTYR